MQNNFDNKKNKGIEPFIDFEKAWTGLKPALDAEATRREKRKKRFIIFWFMLAAIAVGGGIIAVNNTRRKLNSIVLNKGNIQQTTQQKVNADERSFQANNTNETNDNNTTSLNLKSSAEEKNKTTFQQKSSNTHQSLGNKQFNIKREKVSNIKQSLSQKNNAFSNIKSFANLNEYKKNNEVTIVNKKSLNTAITNIQNNIQIASNSIATIDTVVVAKDSPKIKATVVSDNNAIKSNIKLKTSNNLNYGLQWNIPMLIGVNYFDINTVKQPATLLIPTVWINKKFGTKHNVQLQLNPYSQYFVNNKAIVSNDVYIIRVQSGSQINNKPDDIVYSETVSFNKLISIEASLLYNYQLTNKIKMGIGISNNWLQGALLQNKIVKNNTIVTRDSLYGINKQDKEWNNLQSTFMLGKIEVQYQLKKFDIGLSFSKPIGNVFSSNVQSKTPINTNLFLRWKLK